MQTWILQILETYGALGIFLLIFIENIFPPIPSEVILTFGGFMTTITTLSPFMVILSSTIASLAGALVLYTIASFFSFDKVLYFIENQGKFLRLKRKDIEKAITFYERYEGKTVFFCRMVPIVRSLISIPAGMSKMKISSFIFLTTLGSFIWNTLLIVCGVVLGERWEDVLIWIKGYSYVVLGVAALVIVFFAIRYFMKRKHNKN